MSNDWMLTGLEYVKNAAVENRWHALVDQLEIAEALLKYKIDSSSQDTSQSL